MNQSAEQDERGTRPHAAGTHVLVEGCATSYCTTANGTARQQRQMRQMRQMLQMRQMRQKRLSSGREPEGRVRAPRECAVRCRPPTTQRATETF